MRTAASPSVATPRGAVLTESTRSTVADGRSAASMDVLVPNGCDCDILIHNQNFAVVLATGVAATGTGGALPDAVYGYFFTVKTDLGEGLPSAEISVEVLGGSGSGDVTLTWTDPTLFDAPQGHPATHIEIYGRTAGGPGLFIKEVDIGVQTWTDTGSITPSGAIPSTDASGAGLSMAIETCADAAGRTVDPTTVQPVLFTAGQAKWCGPYSAALYGYGDSGRDLLLHLTCAELANVWIYPLRPYSGG